MVFLAVFLATGFADFFGLADFVARDADGFLAARPRAGAARFAPDLVVLDFLVLEDLAARRPPPFPAAGI
jgi:hypothetical protein